MATGNIKAAFQAAKTNDYGFTSIKVGGTWYGADVKNFKPAAADGDIVEFEAYEKAGKDGRMWPSYKTSTFRKVQGAAPAAAPAKAGYKAANGREDYWTAKAATDEAKDPRIAYFAASERAIAFAAVALANGAIPGLEKAKTDTKLDIIRAFIDGETQRILEASYAQKVPEAKADKPVETETAAEGNPDEDASWAA